MQRNVQFLMAGHVAEGVVASQMMVLKRSASFSFECPSPPANLKSSGEARFCTDMQEQSTNQKQQLLLNTGPGLVT